MFFVDDNKTIHITRGDMAVLSVGADNEGVDHVFTVGDVIRLQILKRNSCEDVILRKDVIVSGETTEVDIYLTKEDTTIGNIINRPTDYWYEIELNPDTAPQTLIGYDDVGAKIFKLYPEGGDVA